MCCDVCVGLDRWRLWWLGFGSAEIRDRAVMCAVVMCGLSVAPMVAPMVIFV